MNYPKIVEIRDRIGLVDSRIQCIANTIQEQQHEIALPIIGAKIKPYQFELELSRFNNAYVGSDEDGNIYVSPFFDRHARLSIFIDPNASPTDLRQLTGIIKFPLSPNFQDEDLFFFPQPVNLKFVNVKSTDGSLIDAFLKQYKGMDSFLQDVCKALLAISDKFINELEILHTVKFELRSELNKRRLE